MENQQVSIANQPEPIIFVAEKGCEFVVNTTTGKSGATQAGLARLFKIPESTLRRHLTARHETNEISPFQGILPVKAVVKYNDGANQTLATVYLAKDVFKLALHYDPELAEEMAEAGSNAFLYIKAGFKIKVVEPEIADKPSQAMLNIAWAKAYILQQQTEVNLEKYPGMKKLVEHLQSELDSTEETEPPISVVGWLIENDIISLLTQTQIYALNRRAATLYRTIHLKSPKRLKCEITGKRSLHYDVNDFVILDMAFDTLEIK